MFKKRIESLELSDVLSFLSEGRAEGLHLDYKRDMIVPHKLAKLGSAFANSAGGVCIIGVEEEDERPKAPFSGGDLGSSPTQTVRQIFRTAVSPPLDPIVSPIIRNPSDPSKAFLVLGFPQSGNAPHATSDGLVYLKFQDHKEPVQPSLHQYARLLESRAATRADRDRIVKEAMEVMWRKTDSWPEDLRPSMTLQRKLINIDLRVCRSYPDGDDLATPQQLVQAIENYRIHFVHLERHWGFPAWERGHLNTFGRGVWSIRAVDGVAISTAIHCEGAFVSRATVAMNEFDMPGGNSKRVPYTYVEDVCGIALSLLRSAYRCFAAFGCYSALTVELRISDEHPDGHSLVYPLLPSFTGLIPDHMLGSARSQLTYRRDIPWASPAELRRAEREIVERYSSAFNVPEQTASDAFLSKTLETIKTDY